MKSTLIYKYLPFSTYLFKILINGELWFNLPKNLNDPFEGEFSIKKYSQLPQISLVKFFYKQNRGPLHLKSITDKLQEIKKDPSIFHKDLYFILKQRLKDNFGVSSFSYIPTSILMWSHYSDSHKGICLGFDKEMLLKTLKYPWKDIYDVDYKSKLCEAELILENKTIGYKNEKEILFRKNCIWKYEKEIRIIAFFKDAQSSRNIQFDKRCINRVILGENSNIDDNKTLQMLIENDPNYSNVAFYTAIKNIENQKMNLQKIKLSQLGKNIF